MGELAVYILLITLSEKVVYLFTGLGGRPLDWKFVAGTVWRGIYFMLYGTGYYFLISYLDNKTKVHAEELRVEKLNSELLRTEKDFLRAQINPHLLFNTLSFIRFAAKKQPEAFEDAIMTLSEIMSFSLDEKNSEFLVLGEEIKQIRNVIKLNQLRFNNRLQISLETTISDEYIPIIPIVLITLTENIFKHGDLLDGDNPAIIRICSDAEGLSFFSSNIPSFSSLHPEKGHQGLKNIASRLAIYYPDRHELSYGLNNRLFVVNLSIRY
ncbi:sensor histidine kinase [Mucilaginibacter sp. SJ]|uniref:sensor histidine kinase n=1 Tax=Mucilaginibacter sp. SJ TaxID=3029053 RepID=UPI0023A92090|nr:sensor histidine kinase [Mucilaginibacter sp. SJ]WEA03857.1 histidine kinase [Mucilaginibacter sp. SJ]